MPIIFKKAIIGRLNRQADKSVGPYSIVLPLFRKDGELWRQREKTAREMVSGVGKEVESPHCKANPPPYNTGLSEEGNSRDPEPLRGTTASGHMDW